MPSDGTSHTPGTWNENVPMPSTKSTRKPTLKAPTITGSASNPDKSNGTF